MQHKKRRGCKYIFPLFQAQKAQYACTTPMNNTVTLQASDNVKNFGNFWTSLVVKVYNPSKGSSLTVYINNAATNYSTKKITLDRIGKNELAGYTTIQGVYIKTPVFGDSANYQKMFNNSLGSMLNEHKLETLDKIRDEILKAPGNTALSLKDVSDKDVSKLFEDLRTAAVNKLGGLAIKTYDSDIFNNWVKTDWIDGENGISKVTALKPDEDGTITMDALNLQQKVYNMLNRIAVSGGTYRDWLETVYTAGRYLDRPETPVFQGGMSQMIEFDEVVATTGNAEGQVLGELAGKSSLLNWLVGEKIAMVLKVARTIADLNDNETITKNDLLKSLNFRRR